MSRASFITDSSGSSCIFQMILSMIILVNAVSIEDDGECVLLPGVCDDNTNTIRHPTISMDNRSVTLLQDAYSKVDGTFYCYKTSEGNFLAYDPPTPDTTSLVHTQLPESVMDLQEAWMASSFEFGEPCLAESSSKDCPDGFLVPHAGMGIINDAGNLYGGGSGATPPNCGGCEEEVIVCLSSARSVRENCSEVILTNDDTIRTLTEENTCSLVDYQHPWILRNRNQYAHNDVMGTGNYFYMVVVQGFPCEATRDASAILGLIQDFAQAFQGILDVWRVQPACDGMCAMISGAVGAWMTYSLPVALSVLCQLRAWGSLDIFNLPGCLGNQAVLKFGSVSVTDDGVVCCPEPHSGGRCNQNYALPTDWASKLVEGSDLDFAMWLASELGNGIGACEYCGWPGDDPINTVCPGGSFYYDDPKCTTSDYIYYIPGNSSFVVDDDVSQKDDTLGDDIIDDVTSGDDALYTEYDGYNCYTGNGGTPVDPTDTPTSSDATKTECQLLCDGVSACTGFTRQSVTSGLCWLRSSILIDECIGGTGYDTWVR